MLDPHRWKDDPDYPAADWQQEVANGDTRLGYVAWCNQRYAEDNPGAWIYDTLEDRCWGPFDHEGEAQEFLNSDRKYLESWGVVLSEPRGTRYKPADYYGTWPKEN